MGFYEPQQTVGVSSNTQVKIPSKWGSGFSADATLGLDHDGWESSLRYDFFISDLCSVTTDSPTKVYYPIAFAPTDVSSLYASLQMFHKSLRLEVAKQYGSLRFHYGCIADWQNQHLYLIYNELYTSSQHFDAWGAGLRSGLYWDPPLPYNLFCELSFACGSLWTRVRLSRTDTTNDIITIKTGSNTWFIQNVLEGAAYIGYRYNSFEARLGLSEAFWLHNSYLLLLSGEASIGDLALVAFRASISYKF